MSCGVLANHQQLQSCWLRADGGWTWWQTGRWGDRMEGEKHGSLCQASNETGKSWLKRRTIWRHLKEWAGFKCWSGWRCFGWSVAVCRQEEGEQQEKLFSVSCNCPKFSFQCPRLNEQCPQLFTANCSVRPNLLHDTGNFTYTHFEHCVTLEQPPMHDLYLVFWRHQTHLDSISMPTPHKTTAEPRLNIHDSFSQILTAPACSTIWYMIQETLFFSQPSGRTWLYIFIMTC